MVEILLFSYLIVSDSATPWSASCQASLSFTISRSLLRLMSIEFVMPSNHFALCYPPSPPAFNLSQHQGLFQWVGSLHQVAKVLELQLHHRSFQWIFMVDFLWDSLVWSPCRFMLSLIFLPWKWEEQSECKVGIYKPDDSEPVSLLLSSEDKNMQIAIINSRSVNL